MSIYKVAIAAFLMASCGNANESREPEPAIQEERISDPTAQGPTVHVFANPDGGFGYDILMNDKLYIHQPYIPAIPGNVSFKSEGDALKAAGHVAGKIRNHIMPPGISVEELDSLGIDR